MSQSQWSIRMAEWQAKADAIQAQHRHWVSMMEAKYRNIDVFVAKCARLRKRFDYQLDQIPAP